MVTNDGGRAREESALPESLGAHPARRAIFRVPGPAKPSENLAIRSELSNATNYGDHRKSRSYLLSIDAYELVTYIAGLPAL
jgi:hypothetical protein